MKTILPACDSSLTSPCVSGVMDCRQDQPVRFDLDAGSGDSCRIERPTDPPGVHVSQGRGFFQLVKSIRTCLLLHTLVLLVHIADTRIQTVLDCW